MTTTKPKLPKFEGREVRTATVKITRAGDGLSEALSIEPEALHHKERVFFVMEGSVEQINHKPINKDDEQQGLTRIHTIEAKSIAKVDEADVRELLDAQKAKVEAARKAAAEQELLEQEQAAIAEEKRKGITRLPGTPGGDE